MNTRFTIDRTHPGPFITVTREYGDNAVELRIARTTMLYPDGNRVGIPASSASDEQLLPYAKQLLMSSLESYY